MDDILPEFTRHAKLDDEDKAMVIENEKNKTVDDSKNETSNAWRSSNGNNTIHCPATDTGSCTAIPMINGKVMMVPVYEKKKEGKECNTVNSIGCDNLKYTDEINITEEVNRSSIWTSLVGQNTFNNPPKKCKTRKQVAMSSNKSRKQWQGVQMLALDEVDSDHEDEGITFKGVS